MNQAIRTPPHKSRSLWLPLSLSAVALGTVGCLQGLNGGAVRTVFASPPQSARVTPREIAPSRIVPSQKAPPRSHPAVASPTGRTPRLLWTPERQAVWNRMRSEGSPWWRELKRDADATGTPAGRAGDAGGYATLAYQVTGESEYARKAWSRIEPLLGTTPGDRNFTREALIGHAWMYDWLYPALTAAQRTRYLETLDHWADMVLGKTGLPGWGTRLDDSDEVVGHYFGVVCLALAAGPESPRTSAYLKEKQVGGLDATGANETSTMRNAIRRYAELADGGEWIESSMYNPNTMSLLFMGEEAVRTATGTDHFPELTRLAPQVARAQIAATTPDLRSEYQWGDTEQPRHPEWMNRVSFLGLLCGIVQDDPVEPLIHRFTEELAHVGPPADPQHAGEHPFPHFYLFYNPYAPASDWREQAPRGIFARGQGVLYFHPGWAKGDGFFGAHVPPRQEVDHEVGFFGDFQLYRKGEWAVTHPLGYGGFAVAGDATNTMLLAGLSSMSGTHHWVAQEFGPTGKWAYLAGTTAGGFYAPPYYDPPPAFVDEWTRSLFYVPSGGGGVDSVIVYDRTRVRDPRKLPKFDRYYPEAQNKMKTAPALKQWILHAPVRPEPSTDGFRWTTPGGQAIRVATLLPSQQIKSVADEKQVWGQSHNFFEAEMKFQLTVTPTQERDWDTFLNVIQASEPGARSVTRLVRAEKDEAEGALLERPGIDDALVLFGARQAGRMHLAGFRVRWTGSTSATELFLLDLDPKRRWTARVNGTAAFPISVSAQGVGSLHLRGADPGARTVDITPG